jgi:biopolymer transport protein ExbD
MAGSSLYRDDDEGAPITDINVTPFVDVVLVLLVVFMVIAKLMVDRGVEVDNPTAKSGGDLASAMKLTVTADGQLYVNGDKLDTDAAAIAKIKAIAATMTKPKVIVDGDRQVAYGGVMHAIDLALRAGVTAVALKNQPP